MYLKLSHHLKDDTPLSFGVPPLEIRRHYSIDRGDVSNLFVLHFSNHSGTHIDAPWHFVASGLRISEFLIDEFVFDRPMCLDLPLGDAQMFRPEHFEPFTDQISECDLLLLRTGYTSVRRSDPERYRSVSPGMSTDGARFLAERFHGLRALGMDTVSLACLQHLEEGIDAHRILLSGTGRKFLIIEDMNLEYDFSKLRRVIALPLFIDGVDSSPCTIMGITD